ncbi:MAG: nicotinate-nucleotide--dimethylbenzimidazole phosphoribosyltransferase, partial [Oscillospiraceae bacterium]|nr:nicotinate-nucleotide--dimethylbenzimidazole phosphoribosyltransferase [Oscillospiraceae bacterium]
VTGRGAGLDNSGLERKINVIERAIALNSPCKNNAVDIILKLGGYDIAGMTGLFLGGAIYKIPIVIDGFILAVSAALAVKIDPLAKEYMLCSHVSKEPAGRKILDLLGLKPLITAELALGEVTGGILLLPLLDGALSVYNSAHSFDDLQIERYVEL